MPILHLWEDRYNQKAQNDDELRSGFTSTTEKRKEFSNFLLEQLTIGKILLKPWRHTIRRRGGLPTFHIFMGTH